MTLIFFERHKKSWQLKLRSICFTYAVAGIELIEFSLEFIVGWTGEATTSAKWSSWPTDGPWLKMLGSKLEDRENLVSRCSLVILISFLNRLSNFNCSFNGTVASATCHEGKLLVTAVSLNVSLSFYSPENLFTPITCRESKNSPATRDKFRSQSLLITTVTDVLG